MQVLEAAEIEDKKPDRCGDLKRAAVNGEIGFAALAREGYPGLQLEKHMLPGVLSAGVWDARKPQSWSFASRNSVLLCGFLVGVNYATYELDVMK